MTFSLPHLSLNAHFPVGHFAGGLVPPAFSIPFGAERASIGPSDGGAAPSPPRDQIGLGGHGAALAGQGVAP